MLRIVRGDVVKHTGPGRVIWANQDAIWSGHWTNPDDADVWCRYDAAFSGQPALEQEVEGDRNDTYTGALSGN